MKSTVALTCATALTLLTGCTLPGGASSSPSTTTAMRPSAASPSTVPTPSPSPRPLSPSVAASPGASLSVLPDARKGAALNQPFAPRGIPLINRQHPVSQGYLPTIADDFKLQPEADKAFATMTTDAEKAGAAIIWRVAFRSYAKQQALTNTPPTVYGDDAASYVALPGTSEHQAGLAVDVASKDGFGDRFPETKEFAWLRANSYKYGWILRYPKGKEAITGFKYEPWHYRYIGPAAAAAFGPNSELTLEEYLGGR